MAQMDTVGLKDARAWSGLDVFDCEGERVGRLTGIYVSGDVGRPEFGLVRTGLFGLRSVLVPLSGAFEEGGALIVDLDKKAIKGAPHLRRDEPLSEDAGKELYAHYGIDPGPSPRLELWELEHAD
jgi:PRC-barrel domain